MRFGQRVLRGLSALLAGGLGAAMAGGKDVVEHGGVRYRVFVTEPTSVALYWRDPQGRRFGQLSRVKAFLEGQGRRVRLLVNAGIFEPDWTPSGLLVIAGRTLRPLNLQSGRGNFYLEPNGVFFASEAGAFVRSSAEFAAWSVARPRLAIQSGPLLLRGGVVHPKFRADSASQLHRNGVGVRRDGAVVFAITEFDQPRRPNLWEFAEFFRAQGCEDALFLDGDISEMAVDPTGPMTPGNHFGAIFAVSEPSGAAPAQ